MAQEYEGLEILDFIKKYTVSTVMILPLFNDEYIIRDTYGDHLLFSQLVLANGLINCYLCFKEDYYLIIEVEKEIAFEDIPYVKMASRDLNSIMLINTHFSGVKKEPKCIKYLLKIPDEFQQDINIIIDSNYSHLSEEYKNRMRVKYEEIGLTGNPLADKFAAKQLSLFIAVKHKMLEKKLSEELQTHIDEGLELYEKFDLRKELKC